MKNVFVAVLMISALVLIGCESDKWSPNEYVVDCTDTECAIPAGLFLMGCNGAVDSECDRDEYPYHEVTLSAYQIGKYEITVSQYQACVDAGNCNNSNSFEPHYYTSSDDSSCNLGAIDKDNHPMNCVSWYGAKAYCEWAGKRLPTEAQWEKAARGTDGRKYPWGNDGVTCDYAVMAPYNEETDENNYGCGTDSTMEVGSKAKGVSPYGVYDMSGNAWEWVSDWYDSDYYEISPSENPTGPETGDYRVLRGGSWVSVDFNLRSSSRGNITPGSRYNFYSFRCVE